MLVILSLLFMMLLSQCRMTSDTVCPVGGNTEELTLWRGLKR